MNHQKNNLGKEIIELEKLLKKVDRCCKIRDDNERVYLGLRKLTKDKIARLKELSHAHR